MLCCLSEVGSVEVEVVDLLAKRLQATLYQSGGEAVFLGQFLHQFLGLKTRGFHLGIVHEEAYFRGAEVLREEMAQSLALFMVEQLGLRGGRLGMKSVLWCEIIIIVSIGIGRVEDLERLIVELDVLESVAGDMHRMIVSIDSVKHALPNVAYCIGDEVSSVGRVEAIGRFYQSLIASRDELVVRDVIGAELVSTPKDEA